MTNFKRNFGIHTFEIQCRLTYEQFLGIKDKLYSLSHDMGSRCFLQNNFLKCTIFSNQGLTVFISSRLIIITMNPTRLIDPDNIIGLYNSRECETDPSNLLIQLLPCLELFVPDSAGLERYLERVYIEQFCFICGRSC